MQCKTDIRDIMALALQVEKLTTIYRRITGIDLANSIDQLRILEHKSGLTCLESDILEKTKLLNEVRQEYFNNKSKEN